MSETRSRSSQLATDSAYRDRALPALRLVRSSADGEADCDDLACPTGRHCGGHAPRALAAEKSTGSGEVIAQAPLDRQQIIEAPVQGRVTRWGDGNYDNALVEKSSKSRISIPSCLSG